MSFDYKKEYKEFYMPKNKPSIVTVPIMNYAAVRGKGNPNDENGEYAVSVSLLYGIAYTIKMSYKGEHKIDGYFEYVVPPLEGFWRQNGIDGPDCTHKENFQFISAIRLPDFVTKEDFDWAAEEAAGKKKQDFSKVEFFTYDEGECVQCMHLGPYDDEPSTIAAMHEYAEKNGYTVDITDTRYHHVQNAFDKGVQDGSVGQTTNKEIVDVKTIMLGLLGIREQIAYAMCNKTMREIFDPETAVRKYIRQMELIFQVK